MRCLHVTLKLVPKERSYGCTAGSRRMSAVGLSTISAPCGNGQFHECLAVGAFCRRCGLRTLLPQKAVVDAISACHFQSWQSSKRQGKAQPSAYVVFRASRGLRIKWGESEPSSPRPKLPLGRKAYYPGPPQLKASIFYWLYIYVYITSFQRLFFSHRCL